MGIGRDNAHLELTSDEVKVIIKKIVALIEDCKRIITGVTKTSQEVYEKSNLSFIGETVTIHLDINAQFKKFQEQFEESGSTLVKITKKLEDIASGDALRG